MNTKYNPNKVIIHGGWLDEEHFFVWAEQKQQKKYRESASYHYPFLFSPFELKLALFRTHEASFYGTFLRTESAYIEVPLLDRNFYSDVGNTPIYFADPSQQSYRFPLEGILLSRQELVTSMNLLHSWAKEDEWEIGDDLQFWLAFFEQIQSNILAGDILPTVDGEWKLTNMDWDGWELSIPPVSLSLKKQNEVIATAKPKQQPFDFVSIANQLTDACIRHLTAQDDQLLEQFQQLKQNKSERLQTWLTAIEHGESLEKHENERLLQEELGVFHSAPFYTGVAVHEPDKHQKNWQLVLFVQDKKDASLILSMEDLQKGNHPWHENPIVKINQDLSLGAEKVPILRDFSTTNHTLTLTLEEIYTFLSRSSPLLQSLGFTIFVPTWWQNKQRLAVHLNMDTAEVDSSSVDPILNWESLSTFDYSISVADTKLSQAEFTKLVEQKQPIINVNGKWVVWDPSQAEKLKEQLEEKKKQPLSYYEAWQMDINEETENHTAEEIEWDILWDDKVNDLLTQVRKKDVAAQPVPDSLQGTLRPYQQEGYSWLMQMRTLGLGSCLADDMGLGKSIQTMTYLLAVFAAQKQEDVLHTPFLLICPTSLIGNWVQELEKFAPSLKTFVHHGDQRLTEEQLHSSESFSDIIITSYTLVTRDDELWTNFVWNGLILDEAQHIKNVNTKQRRAIKKLNAKHRIALTGTPVENRLKELWSIIDLLNPNYLGSYRHFQQTFIKEIEGREQNEQRLKQLQQLISPFLLRRSKEDEALNLQLPKKSEQTYRLSLSVEQASLYQAVVNHLIENVQSVSDMQRRALILSSLTKLKQICNHPAHFLKEDGPLPHRSEKWDLLETLVEQITESGEKALIFTQYKEMGTLIQKGLSEKLGLDIPFLHGSLNRKKREMMIQQFSNDEKIPVFILSLKAGGVGLNLTAASHVIHYDRWWNPAVEKQATDRAYRIGQTENVTVHKLITTGTLEERIDRMMEKKQHLSDQVLKAADHQLSELSTDELIQLLEFRKE